MNGIIALTWQLTKSSIFSYVDDSFDPLRLLLKIDLLCKQAHSRFWKSGSVFFFSPLIILMSSCES